VHAERRAVRKTTNSRSQRAPPDATQSAHLSASHRTVASASTFGAYTSAITACDQNVVDAAKDAAASTAAGRESGSRRATR
jgi:flagellar basal body rod protein FlgB